MKLEGMLIKSLRFPEGLNYGVEVMNDHRKGKYKLFFLRSLNFFSQNYNHQM